MTLSVPQGREGGTAPSSIWPTLASCCVTKCGNRRGGRHVRDRAKEGQRPHVRCPNHFCWNKTTCDGNHQPEVNLPTQLLARGAEPDSCNVQWLSLYHLQTNRWYSIREQVWPLAVTLADRRLKSCFGLDYTGKYTAQLFGCRRKMMRWKCAAAL